MYEIREQVFELTVYSEEKTHLYTFERIPQGDEKTLVLNNVFFTLYEDGPSLAPSRSVFNKGKLTSFFRLVETEKDSAKVLLENLTKEGWKVISGETPEKEASISDKEDVLRKIVNIFETGSAEGDYSLVTSNPEDAGGLTYGRSQTTLNSGNLYLMLASYFDFIPTEGTVSFDASYGDDRIFLKKHLNRFRTQDQSLNSDLKIRSALKHLGQDPLMQAVQDRFFDDKYLKPALSVTRKLGLVYPLSAAVVYDSFVHGSFSDVRKLFPEVPPYRGGDEKKWVKAYVASRTTWLSSRQSELLRNTVYRMDAFRKLIRNENWDLKTPLMVRGVEIT